MNVPARQEGISYKNVPIVSHGGGGRLMPQTFGDCVAFSEIMARSQHAIPKHLREVPGACLAVTMQALRWELDPFLVASKSYNVKDIIAYEAQLIAAVVHTRAPLKTRPEYEYTGEGADRRCTVSAVFDDGVTRKYESPRLADIKVKNSPLWTADVDQQLGYYSIRAFARRYCPEVILGVYTPEEAESFRGPDNARDVTPRPSLSERLAGGTAGNGFSHERVISEVDGASSSQDAAPPASPPSAGPEMQPASDVASPVADAGTPSMESAATHPVSSDPDGAADDGVQAGGLSNDARSRGTAGLPPDWQKEYALVLRRAQKPISLGKYAKQYWDGVPGGWPAVKDTDDGELAVAVFDTFKNHFGNQEAIDAQLRELEAM